MNQSTLVAREAAPGTYLTFTVGPEMYGIEILKVQEIIGMLKITRVPSMPASIRGVVNLRGRVIPVVDLRARFGAEVVDGERTCIIITQVQNGTRTFTMGAIVDAVSEVADIADTQLSPVPDFGCSVEADFLLGVATLDSGVALLVDSDLMLTTGELDTLGGLREDSGVS